MLVAGRGHCNMGYQFQTILKQKYHEISFARNVLLICRIVLKFPTEHGSITAVLCANF